MICQDMKLTNSYIACNVCLIVYFVLYVIFMTNVFQLQLNFGSYVAIEVISVAVFSYICLLFSDVSHE